MSKAQGIAWLEATTGEELVRQPLSGEGGRHLSLRIPNSLFERLEAIAIDRGETVSQTARRLLTDGIDRSTNPDCASIDTVIAALQELRRTLTA